MELDKMEVFGAYMPKVPSVSRTAAIYLSITNHSKETIKLNDVSSELARHAMFHQSVEVQGIAKMHHINQLVVEPGQVLELKPNGIHIMLMGLNKLDGRDSFYLTLHSGAHKKEVRVNVGNSHNK